MRSRLAALSLLSIAFAAIAAAPIANASPQAVGEVELAPVPAVTVDLAVRPQFFINSPNPAIWRLTHQDSAGHQLLRVEMRYLPNPAAQCARPTQRVIVSNFSARIGFDPSKYVRGSRVDPLPLGVPVSNRIAHERLSSALRAGAAIGTLASTGRFRSKS